MDLNSVATLLGIGVVAAGVITAHVRLAGRVDSHDVLFIERKTIADEREEKMQAFHEEVTVYLRRFEDKLDRIADKVHAKRD